jgi:serine/threonine protein kinase
MRARLTDVDEQDCQVRFEWDGHSITIGRGSACDIRLADSQVSRRHCRVANRDGDLVLTDLDSSSGTLVNGIEVTFRELESSDVISLGNTQLRFELIGDDSESSDFEPANGATRPQHDQSTTASGSVHPQQISQDEIDQARPELREIAAFVGQKYSHFRLTHVVAIGERSVVFRATNLKNRCGVALKILASEFSGDEQDTERLMRGINSSGKAAGPNLVHLQSAGRNGGRYWLAMDWVPGSALPVHLESCGHNGTLSVDDLVRLGRDIASALETAAGFGFVHRNVTPENILYDSQENRFKLNNLMLARGVDAHASPAVTVDVTQVPGDPQFLAPEAFTPDGKVDSRSDLYSLGCCLYLAATGEVPLEVDGQHLMKQMLTVLQKTPRPIRQLRADVPRELEDVVMRLLAKSPDDRIQSATELIEILRDIVPSDVNEHDDDPLNFIDDDGDVVEDAFEDDSDGDSDELVSVEILEDSIAELSAEVPFEQVAAPAPVFTPGNYSAPAHLAGHVRQPQPTIGAVAAPAAIVPPPGAASGFDANTPITRRRRQKRGWLVPAIMIGLMLLIVAAFHVMTKDKDITPATAPVDPAVVDE